MKLKNEAKPFQRPFIFAKMCNEEINMLYDTGPILVQLMKTFLEKFQ
jgi:hypothetical protein